MATNDVDLNGIPGITDTDRANLLAGDEHFTPHSWDDLGKIIAENNLSVLKRKPSDLVRYIEWTSQMKAQYGTITNYICKERLQWEPLPSGNPGEAPLFAFENPEPFAARPDYKVLRNDWPYGFEEGITHLVVWLKTPIPVQMPEGFLLPESRNLLERFVQKYFVQPVNERGMNGEANLQWFKNWVSLQSVRGLDHLHVLVKDVPDDLIEEWTANICG